MTLEQKTKIITLRANGFTYANISKSLGLSVNTVKSFYRRCPEGVNAVCKFCGKPITQPKGTRQKKFCSDTCRMKWWNSHREEGNKKAIYKYKCEYCGKEFEAYGNKKRKYCSRDCYIKQRFGDDNDEQE